MVVNQAVSYAPCVLPQAQVVLDTSMGTVGVRWRALALIQFKRSSHPFAAETLTIYS